MKSSLSPEKQLERGRCLLILDEPFFGALLMRLKPQITTSVPTFSTDGKRLLVNPDFMSQMDDRELRTILAHEVLHCALLHPYRRGARDIKRFNIAADYAINNYLENYNQETVARGRTAPFSFTGPLASGLRNPAYNNMSAEQIYALLPNPPPSGGGNGGSGAGAGTGSQNPKSKGQGQPGTGSGDDEPTPGEFTDGAANSQGQSQGKGSEAEQSVGESEWKVALKQAAMAAKAHGKLPASLAALVEELTQPKVSWRDQLRTFLTSCAQDDYSWARTNRRYTSVTGCVLPGLHSLRLGPVCVAVDTSGSVYCEAPAFFSEVRSILFDCRPEKLLFCQCDAAIADWQELEPWMDFPVREARGGGGTDFRPVFDRLDQEATPPAVLIYLTDLYGTFPEQPPGYPVIWAAINDQQAPFGTTIQIKP